MEKSIAIAWLLAGCAGQNAGGASESPDAGEIDAPAGAPGTDAGSDSGLATIPGVISVKRAEEWVAVKLQYCQAPNEGRDYDTACAAICERHDNPLWDPYRSDCSGLVSWAWKLPAPGRVTTEFAPFRTDITHTILATNLRPGDAVNNADHIMLFKAWITHPTEARFIEEPGCSSPTPYAHELTARVSVSGTSISVIGDATFTAIRYPHAP
jgi:hypothetical protein